jgi:hypothetical protein
MAKKRAFLEPGQDLAKSPGWCLAMKAKELSRELLYPVPWFKILKNFSDMSKLDIEFAELHPRMQSSGKE